MRVLSAPALCLALALTACGGQAPVAHDSDPGPSTIIRSDAIDLLVIAGQSNAEGRAPGPLAEPVDVSGIDYWPRYIGPTLRNVPTAFGPLGPYVQPPVTTEDGWHGVEVYLAPALRDAGRNPVIVKAARGGSLLAQWLPGDSSNFWRVLTQTVDLSLLAAREAYAPRDVRLSLVWIQGESDAQGSGGFATYGADLATFLDAFRAGYGASVPVYVVQISDQLVTLPQRASVRSQQAAVADPQTHVVSVDDVTASDLQTDGLHYTAMGYHKVALDVAESILSVTTE